jgi:hypothetical protein
MLHALSPEPGAEKGRGTVGTRDEISMLRAPCPMLHALSPVSPVPCALRYTPSL